MCQACRNFADKEKQRRWEAAHPEKAKRRAREYERRNNETRKRRWHDDPAYRESVLEAHRRYAEKNRERLREETRERHRRYRKAVIELYGGMCECCGEKNWEFLALDHINGGGSKERKTMGVSAYYRRFRGKKLEKLPGFRLLCHNCNSSLGFYGYCPHKSGVK